MLAMIERNSLLVILVQIRTSSCRLFRFNILLQSFNLCSSVMYNFSSRQKLIHKKFYYIKYRENPNIQTLKWILEVSFSLKKNMPDWCLEVVIHEYFRLLRNSEGNQDELPTFISDPNGINERLKNLISAHDRS